MTVKALFFVLAAIAVYLLLRLGRQGRHGGTARKAKPGAGPESMVSCARCGLHVPASESLPAGGRYYCCEEHRRLDSNNDAA